MSRRRVVVTGLGLVSPVGNSVAEGWANLVAGRSGIANITKFDASAFACRFAGEVKGFDIEQYMPAKEARHMDAFIHYGMAASIQAVLDAGLPHGRLHHRHRTARQRRHVHGLTGPAMGLVSGSSPAGRIAGCFPIPLPEES